MEQRQIRSWNEITHAPDYHSHCDLKMQIIRLIFPLFFLALSLTPAFAESGGVSLSDKSSILDEIGDRTRLEMFTEFMTPAFSGNGSNIPKPDGTSELPAYSFSYAWFDYEFAKDWKAVYWQRFLVFYDTLGDAQGVNLVPKNMRFALRKTNVWNSPNLSSDYDFFIQPGTAPEAFNAAGRSFEWGVRAKHFYNFPGSRWSVGNVMELMVSHSFQGRQTGQDFYGWTAFLGTYKINNTFSTEHAFTMNFKHDRPAGNGWGWDAPRPYIQNGVSMGLSKHVYMALMLNNYVSELPTLKNTWASLWLNLKAF